MKRVMISHHPTQGPLVFFVHQLVVPLWVLVVNVIQCAQMHFVSIIKAIGAEVDGVVLAYCPVSNNLERSKDL